MAKPWYFQIMGAEIGPLTSAELMEKVQIGQIQPETLVRSGKDGKWIPADRQDREAFGLVGTFHDLQFPVTSLLRPGDELSSITAVGPKELPSRKSVTAILRVELKVTPTHTGGLVVRRDAASTAWPTARAENSQAPPRRSVACEKGLNMASVSTDRETGLRKVQFAGLDGKRKTLRLGRVSMNNALSVCDHVEEIINAGCSTGRCGAQPPNGWPTSLP